MVNGTQTFARASVVRRPRGCANSCPAARQKPRRAKLNRDSPTNYRAAWTQNPRRSCPIFSTQLTCRGRANKAAPELDERHVKTICASRHLRGRRLDEVSVIQIEAFKRERTAAKSKWGRAYKPGS